MTASLVAVGFLAALQAQNPRSVKDEPLPEGMQWFNLGPVRFRDVELRAQFVRSGTLRTDLPFVQEVRQTPFMTEYSRLEFGDLEHEGIAVGVSWDFNAFRLSADFFFGDWEGEGTLRTSTGMQPESVVDLALEGETLGLRFGVEWPAIRYLSPDVEVDFGPKLGLNGYQQHFDSPSESPFPFSDRYQNGLVGSIGPRLSVRFGCDRFFFAVEAEVDWLFDSLTGREERVGIAFGLRF